ncbi:MAG: hypothetical protein V9G23_15650 [Giesbergeria sp.]
MSTLSFQDYVRERMLRRRHEALRGKPRRLPGRAPSRRTPETVPVPQRCAPLPMTRHNPLSQGSAASPQRATRRESACRQCSHRTAVATRMA